MVDGRARAAVVQLLLGDHERAAEAAGAFADHSEWLRAVVLCSDWAVLPALQRRLAGLGITLDGAAGQRFRAWTNASFLRSASRLNEGGRALAALGGAGIDAVALKGVAAIATVHSGARDRTIGDTDVLIRRTDIERAVSTLERAGFVPGTSASLSAHVDAVRRHPNVGNESVSVFAGDGSEIDLHWQMGRVDTERVLAGARPADVYGWKIAVVNEGHGLLLGAHHILRNGFELDRAMRDLIDGGAWLEALRAKSGLGPTIRQAREWGLAAAALAMVQILAWFDPAGAAAASVPELADGIPESERRVAEALVECFWLQRSTDGWNADLPRLFDRRRLVQFTRRTIERRVAAADRLPLGRRLYRFGRSLPRTRWRLVRALRRAQGVACSPDGAQVPRPGDAGGQ